MQSPFRHAFRDSLRASASVRLLGAPGFRGFSAATGEVDVLLVGGGFSSCWFADRLNTSHPSLSLMLVEKSGRIGGRLKSDENDSDVNSLVKDELGGMRVFPSKMKGVASLLRRFRHELAPLKLGDAGNIYHINGASVAKAEAKFTGQGKWAGQHPSSMSAAALKAYKETEWWAKCYSHAYACPELRSLSIPAFFERYAGASAQETAEWFHYGGYNLYHSDVQSNIYVHDGELYGADIEHHHFLKDGYMAVVTNLLKASGVTPRKFTTVTSVQRRGDGKLVATMQDGSDVVAGKIVIGATALQLAEIEGVRGLVSAERVAAVDSCKAIPLFKCFLEFAQPWWQKYGLTHGKTTTDLDCRQIHYYDRQDLLIYNSDGDSEATKYASRWNTAFQTDRGAALRKMYEEVKRVHVAHGIPEADIPEPLWDECVHAYWPGGSHKWQTGADVETAIELIADGRSDGSEIYIVGDAFSDMQGWVEGAINTCQIAHERGFAK